MKPKKIASSSIVSGGLLSAAIFIASAKPSYAYIDPGTGSFILQILAATLFASLFTLKLFWRRFTNGFSNLLGRVKRGKNTSG